MRMLAEALAVVLAMAIGYVVTDLLLRRWDSRLPRHTPLRPGLSAPSALQQRCAPSETSVTRRRPKDKSDDAVELVQMRPASAAGHVAASAPVLQQHEYPSHPQHCPAIVPLTAQQLAAMAQLREAARPFSIPLFEEDETTWPRFLRAVRWDVGKATEMLRVVAEFRSTLGPITPELRRLISLGYKTGVYSILPQRDLYGRVVLYVCLRRHNPKTRDVDVTFRCIVWFLDMFFSRHVLKTHHKQYVVMVNFRGFGLQSSDLALGKALLPLQSYYPDFIGQVVLIDFPMIVWGLWRVIKPLLNADLQNKIVFLSPSVDELKAHFPVEGIPRECGGLWDDPEPEIDLFAEGFRVQDYKVPPGEVVVGVDDVPL